MSKLFFKSLLLGLSLFGSVQGIHLENYQGTFGKMKRKMVPGMDDWLTYAETVEDIFNQIVPEGERKNWKEKMGDWGVDAGPGGSNREWIFVVSNGLKPVETIYVNYLLKPCEKEKRQFKDIEESIAVFKTHLRGSDATLNIQKVSDKEAIEEIICKKCKEIKRVILCGDWLIALTYEQRMDPQNSMEWEKNRDLWLGRFKNIKFE